MNIVYSSLLWKKRNQLFHVPMKKQILFEKREIKQHPALPIVVFSNQINGMQSHVTIQQNMPKLFEIYHGKVIVTPLDRMLRNYMEMIQSNIK
jgi:hypothetical protein